MKKRENLNDLYLQRDELLAELYNAEEKGSHQELKKLARQLNEIESRIKTKEIEEVDY